MNDSVKVCIYMCMSINRNAVSLKYFAAIGIKKVDDLYEADFLLCNCEAKLRKQLGNISTLMFRCNIRNVT